MVSHNHTYKGEDCMKLEFLGAAHEVTGSCHYVRLGDVHLLVDCGMEQGADLYENQEIPVNPAEIDYVLITHAHIDHSGLLPLIYSHGFRGKVYSTRATMELCNIMLKDSAHIQMFEAEWKNRKAQRAGRPLVEPMYTMDDAVGVLEHFIPCEYGEIITLCPEVSIRFTDAGHLLGSSSIEVWGTEGEEKVKLLFSGDIGHGNKPLIRNPQYVRDADYVIVESTYGDRLHENPPDYAEELARVCRETFVRGGNLVIPAFSVGRTQEMLYFFRKIKTEGLLPEFQDFEVYVDSPLAIEATNVFHKNVRECFDKEALELVRSGKNPIRFPGLRVSITSDESKMINFIEEPKVIISASGMCEAGRIRHHLKHNLWRSDSTILFVGYQVPGTLGNLLLGGAKEVKLFGESIEVHAQIKNLAGISGHADQQRLLDWVRAIGDTPKRVFVVHGEDQVCDTFASLITKEIGIPAIAPYSGDIYDLAANACIARGSRERKAKKTKEGRTVSTVFTRLLAAAERLLAIVRRSEGRPNKELGKLADQINALCDKWED